MSTKFRKNPPSPHARMVQDLGVGEEVGGLAETKTEEIGEEAEEKAIGVSEEAKRTIPVALRRPVPETLRDSTP